MNAANLFVTNFVLTLLCVLSPSIRAAEPKVLYEMGKPFEVHLASNTNLVLSIENNFCSWKPMGTGTPVQLKFTRGLADPTQASLEVAEQPNVFLRHFLLRLRTSPMPTRRDPLFEGDATFAVQPGSTENAIMLRSFNFRDAYVGRTHSQKAYVIPDPAPASAELVIIYK
jgi:hypothetical protein